MYRYILLAALVCLIPTAAHGSDVNNTPVHLVITTHNPSCTAVHLDRFEAVRLTDVRVTERDGVFGYSADEFRNGVNITAVVWVHEIHKIVSELQWHTTIRNMAVYLPVTPNSTLSELPILLMSYTNAYTESLGRFDFPMGCDIDQKVVEDFLDAIGRDGASDPTPISKPTTMSYVGPDIAYGSASIPMPVNLTITSHNPPCTAALLDHLGVARLTDVQQLRIDRVKTYSAAELVRGINITAVVWPSEVNKTMTELVERPEVRSVVAHTYTTQNTTSAKQSALLAQAINPNVKTWEDTPGKTRCDIMSQDLINMIMDDAGWGGVSGPNPAPTPTPSPNPAGDSELASETLTLDTCPPTEHYVDPETRIYHCGDLIKVLVWTYNTTDTWRFLQENGALVLSAGDEDGMLGTMKAAIPISIMWALHELNGTQDVDITKGIWR